MMKGQSIRWDRTLIRAIINGLLERHILTIERSYSLKTSDKHLKPWSDELEQESKRIKTSMTNMDEEVIGKLKKEGKLKSIPCVPGIQDVKDKIGRTA